MVAPGGDLYSVRCWSHGEVSLVVHSSGVLLAAGAGSAGALSVGVAAVASVSPGGNRGWRRARTGERDRLSSRAGAADHLNAGGFFKEALIKSKVSIKPSLRG